LYKLYRVYKLYNGVMETMKVSEARAHFRAVIERVKKGEEVTLTQNGEPVAKLVSVEERPSRWRPETLEAAERTLREIREARSRPFDIGRGISVERGEQLIREIRAERDEE
jgi:prevent-host-death family protein